MMILLKCQSPSTVSKSPTSPLTCVQPHIKAPLQYIVRNSHADLRSLLRKNEPVGPQADNVSVLPFPCVHLML